MADPRIRAVVAMATHGRGVYAGQFNTTSVPVRLMVAERDAVLAGKYHGAYVAANLPAAQANTVPGRATCLHGPVRLAALASEAETLPPTPRALTAWSPRHAGESRVAEFLDRQLR